MAVKTGERKRYMIILDLEWNSGCDEERLEEILQIGAVKVERLGGPIIDTFSINIRPSIHKQLCLNARLLPDAKAFSKSKVRFPEAVERFLDWCGGETAFAAWGGGDFKVLRENAQRWEKEYPFPENALNLQTAFSHTLKAGQQIALHKAVEYCGIPDSFTFHNALNDAMYTALVARFITPEGVELTRNPPKIKKKDLGVGRGWNGPFESWEQALNSHGNRRPACLRCGQVRGVGQWFYLQPRLCYSMFQCGEHGRFLCRLQVKREQGVWWGKLSVFPMSGERRKEYLTAKRAHTFDCARTGKKHRRVHRRGRRETA